MAYSNSWQTGYYAYLTYSDCDTIPFPPSIHVRAYLYAGTSRSINLDSYPRSETRSAFSYKSSYGLSPTLLPIRVISSPFLSSFEPRPFTIVAAIDSLPY